MTYLTLLKHCADTTDGRKELCYTWWTATVELISLSILKCSLLDVGNSTVLCVGTMEHFGLAIYCTMKPNGHETVVNDRLSGTGN